MEIRLKGNYNSRRVWIDGRELTPSNSQRYVNHSPNGFMWGYGGSGPSQLALAICLELFPVNKALKMYQTFKWNHIATLPQSDFDVKIKV